MNCFLHKGFCKVLDLKHNLSHFDVVTWKIKILSFNSGLALWNSSIIPCWILQQSQLSNQMRKNSYDWTKNKDKRMTVGKEILKEKTAYHLLPYHQPDHKINCQKERKIYNHLLFQTKNEEQSYEIVKNCKLASMYRHYYLH